MTTDVGEYIVGAYLKLIEKCDFVDYNVREPGGGLPGLNELDVIGLNFKTKTAYLCEVTTHLLGTRYGTATETVGRIAKKHQVQKRYANKYLHAFPNRQYMYWSLRVPEGPIVDGLQNISSLTLVINSDYAAAVEELRKLARKETFDSGNPFFRILQILEHLRT